MKSCLPVLACLLAGTAAASPQDVPASPGDQTEVPDARTVRDAGGTVPRMLSGPDDDGKKALFARGIQGEMLVAGVIGVDGRMHDARVTSSSRSDELDAFGLGLVTGSKFDPAKDKGGQPVAVRVTMPVYLWKDSLADGSIFAKKCGDFVLDADWFARAFPEKRPDQMRSWLMFNGAMVPMELRSGQKIVQDFPRVYAECRAKPSRKFSDVAVGK